MTQLPPPPPSKSRQPSVNASLQELRSINAQLKKLNQRLTLKPDRWIDILKKNAVWVAVPTVVLVLVIALANRSPRYEYQIQFFNDLVVEESMSDLGAKGWKVISCRRATNLQDNYGYECVIERQR
jgi:hypothetical protein